MPKRFTGRVAVVTGGATGLGRAFAEALLDDGAAVALADVDVGSAEEAAAQLAGRDAAVSAVECDVADERSVQRAVGEVVERHGGVDILVNNAARHLKKYNQPFSTLTNDEIRGLFDVNVLGIVNCSLACRASMAERGGGAIVNISSAAGYVASTPYGVTKLAVRGLTIAFATELAGDGIRVERGGPDDHADRERPGRVLRRGARTVRRDAAARPPRRDRRRRRAHRAVPVLRRGRLHHRRDDPGDRRRRALDLSVRSWRQDGARVQTGRSGRNE